MTIAQPTPNLKPGITYKIRYLDEEDYFYAYFICEDRGFLCFDRAGEMIVCRPSTIEISN